MMHRTLQKITLIFHFAIWLSFCAVAQPTSAGTAFAKQKSPFFFIENKGQIRDQNGLSRGDIDFRISSQGVNVFVGSGRLQYQWVKPVLGSASGLLDKLKERVANNQAFMYDMYRMDVTLVGANPNASLIKQNKQNYFERYYLPQCGSEGAMAFSYDKLIYKDVYPGIDWVLYISNAQLEYDFVIHPGARVSDIQLQYGGATSLQIEEDGDLAVATPFGNIVEKAPYSFQQNGKMVPSQYVLQGNIMSFNTAKSYEGVLTIDPKLMWGTYYGDSCLLDYGTGIASAFRSEDVYFAGHTYSLYNIATSGAYQIKLAGGFADAFLAKFNKDGIRLWATYYGGSDGDGQQATLATDTLGYLYMAATTYSPDTTITTPGSYQRANGGLGDVVLVKFDSSGKRQWATLYGGGGMDVVSVNIASDGNNIYLGGGTTSIMDIASPGSHQTALNGLSDAYLVKFNHLGQRQWGTYYGGNSNDGCKLYSGLVCDKKGYIYMCGQTNSASDIATPGTQQTIYGGRGDAFLVKFDPSGKRIWGTYLGSADDDEEAQSITCDDSCNIYLAGIAEGGIQTTSAIASGNGHQTILGGKVDNFLVKFDSSGIRKWGTYYGGLEDEIYATVVCNGVDKVFLLGATGSSANIATPGTFQDTYGGGSADMFLAEFDASGIRKWSTYYGGPETDQAADAVFVEGGAIYLTAMVLSKTGLTTPGSHQEHFNSRFSMPLFAKICVAADGFPNVSITGKDSICANSSTLYTIPEFTEIEGYIWTLPDGWTGNSETNSISVTTGSTGGTISLQVIRCGDTSSSWTYEVYVVPSEAPVITVDGFELGATGGPYSNYQWLLNGKAIAKATDSTYLVKENGEYAVITINQWGCVDTSDVYPVTNYTGVSDLTLLGDQINIYPNPSKNRVYIQSPVPVNIVLRTIEGRELLRKYKASYVELHNLSVGIYTLSILNEENVLLRTQKLVKTE